MPAFFIMIYLVNLSTKSCICVQVANDKIICPAPPRFSRSVTDTPNADDRRDSISRTVASSIVFDEYARPDARRVATFTIFSVSATDIFLFII